MKLKNKLLAALLAASMVVTSFSTSGLTIQAAKETETTEDLNELYSNPDLYPTGREDITPEQQQWMDDNIVKIKTLDDYYEIVGEEDSTDAKCAEKTLVESIDNSQNPAFPGISFQYGGSCVCWADVYTVATYTINKAKGIASTDDSVKRSPLFVYNMTRSTLNTSGGASDTLVGNVLQEIGAPNLSLSPKTSADKNWSTTWVPTEEAWLSAAANRISSWHDVETPTGDTPITSVNDADLNTIKGMLADGNIIGMGTWFYTWNYDTIPAGYSHQGEQIVTRCDNYRTNSNGVRITGGHQVAIVGYDDTIWVDINQDGKKQEGEKGAFKIANSHGTNYANQGFVWLSYDALNLVSSVNNDKINTSNRMRAIMPNNIYFFYAEKKSNSSYYVKADLKTKARNQVRMKITATAKDGVVKEYPVHSFYNRNNHELALDGSATATNGTIAIDLSTVVKDINETNFSNYTWAVVFQDTKEDSNTLVVNNVNIVNSDQGTVYKPTKAISDLTLNNTTETITMDTSAKNLQISSFTSSIPSGKLTATMPVTLTAQASGGNGTLQYQFEVGADVIQAYSASNKVVWTPEYAFYNGDYNVTVRVKDEAGETVSDSMKYQVNVPPIISGMGTTPSQKATVGDTVKLVGSVANANAGTGKLSYQWEVQKTGEAKKVVSAYSTSNIVNWIPSTAGEYKIYFSVKDECGYITSHEISYTVEKKKGNYTTIHYKGYSPVYLHYKIGNGAWTILPGIKMTEQSDKAGYTYQITVDLGTETTLTACFNNGRGSWDSANGKNYTFGVGTYGCCNGKVEQFPDETGLRVTNFEADKKSSASITDDITLTVQAAGGKAPYTYRYGTIFQNTETYISDYISDNTEKFMPRFLFSSASGDAKAVGRHTLFVDVKDAEGKVVRKTIENYAVEGLKITSLNANLTSPQKVNTSITLTANVENEGTYRYNSYEFFVEKAGVRTSLGYGNQYSCIWTPKEVGTYTIGYTLKDYLGQTATKTMNYVINDDITNETTIYYKGYANAYIHYKIGNGTWTTAPGMKMASNTEKAGYTHKVTINLGEATSLTACFNNGSGSWDSNNGANYSFGVGTYGYSNGKIVEMDEGLKIDSFQTDTKIGGTNTKMVLSVSASGGKAPYTYSYGYVYNGKSVSLGTKLTTTAISFWPSSEGIYQFTMQVEDAEGTIVTKTIDNFVVEGPKLTLESSAVSPQKVGTSIVLTAQAHNLVYYSQYASYTYTVSKAGVTQTLTNNSDHTATWKPTEAGTYTVTANYVDISLGKNMSASMEYTIQDINLNQTTIYYKGYSNPNIHYKVGNGSWTSVPGVAMIATTEKAGYTHKMTITLGDATTLTACFNDGKGNWDSRNGANYSFGVGTYTISNGVITKIN